MRYTAVTLLFAAFTASAVLAQSPRRESPLAPPTKVKVRTAEVPVKPLAETLLRVSVKAIWREDSRGFWVSASEENISGRDIYVSFIRRAAVGNDGPGHGWLPGGSLRAGQSVVTKPIGPFPLSSLPLFKYEVFSIVFMDGTTWCADVCAPQAELYAGFLVGKRVAAERLLKLLAGGGADAVNRAVIEKLTEDDSDLALKAAVGEWVGVMPPSGHTPEWEYGFHSGTKWVAYALREPHVLNGPGPIEDRFRQALQATQTAAGK